MRLYRNTATPPAETWLRVSAVESFPSITSRLNMYGIAYVTLRDSAGALYATWEALDLIEMIITDDAGDSPTSDPATNTIFRGILTNKIFKKDSLELEISGIGCKLYRNSFGAQESVNYVLAEGIVGIAPATSTLPLKYEDDEGALQNFSWDEDRWILGGNDVGIIVKDTTASYSEQIWTSTAVNVQNATTTGGNNASVTAYMEDPTIDYLWWRENNTAAFNSYCDCTVGGAGIDSTSYKLKSIKIEYNFRTKCKSFVGPLFLTSHCTGGLYVKKDTTWETVRTSYVARGATVKMTQGAWAMGIDDTNEDYVNEGAFLIEDTDAELQKYLNKTGDDYDEMKGIRFRIYGKAEGADGFGGLDIDYIRVTIQYRADDIREVMYQITDSSTSDVTCEDVSDWSAQGLTDETDLFQIGENTRKIMCDIFGYAGLHYRLVDDQGGTKTRPWIQPTGDGTTTDWDSTEANHYDAVDDDNDATLIDTGTSGEEEEFTFGNIYIPVEAYISNVDVKLRCKRHVNEEVEIACKISWDDGATWSSSESTSGLGTVWENQTLSFSSLTVDEQYDADRFQIQLLAPTMIAGGNVYVAEVDVQITLTTSDYDRYMAREFKGQHCYQVLNSVCELEGAHWFEDYVNNMIGIVKFDNMDDSGVDLTDSDYGWDWEYEDECNQVKGVFVWGKSSYNNADGTTKNVFAKAIDKDVDENGKTIQIIDDSISTNVEAKNIADENLDRYKTKRPSIKISCNTVQADIQLGTYVGLTMARPTVGATDYDIRMITRSQAGKTGVTTTIHCGLGESSWDEKLFKAINKAEEHAHKALSTKLNANPYDIGSQAVDWDSVIGAAAGAVAAIEADDTIYTKTEVDAYLGIGVANAKWVQCVLEGVQTAATDSRVYTTYRNATTNDYDMRFSIPLPMTLGSKNLKIKDIIVWLQDADANDFIDRVRLLGWSAHDTSNDEYDLNPAALNSIAEWKMTEGGRGFTTKTLGGTYESAIVLLNNSITTAGDLDISGVFVEYYYD